LFLDECTKITLLSFSLFLLDEMSMNVDGCTHPVFSLIFVDGCRKKRGRILDHQIDGWMERNGWIRCRWADK
jgi:hypothetical protein